MRTAKDVISKYLDVYYGFYHDQAQYYARRLSTDWDNIPEKFKPGGLIKMMSPEDRELLKGLTAADLQDRV